MTKDLNMDAMKGLHVSRKTSKPLMEKRRRARINNCLTQLKLLILEATRNDSAQCSKLEKADILEMTVKYLKNLQRNQLTASIVLDPASLPKYRAGYNECLREVSHYLESFDGIKEEARIKLMHHLDDFINKSTESMVRETQLLKYGFPACSPTGYPVLRPSNRPSDHRQRSRPVLAEQITPDQVPWPFNSTKIESENYFEYSPTSKEPVWRPW